MVNGETIMRLSKDEETAFRAMFDKFCSDQQDKGNCCTEHCVNCPVNVAYHNVFDRSDAEEAQYVM